MSRHLRRPHRRTGGLRVLVAVLVATALATAKPVGAQDATVVDPLEELPPPDSSELMGSVRLLDPQVRRLDPQVRRLDPEVRELRIEERAGDQTTVTISTDVLFAFDSAELTPSAVAVMDDLAARVAGASVGGDVLVVGHTDGIGTMEYNQELSERRAAAVAAALEGRLGGRRIMTEGRSSSEPVAPETVSGADDPTGRARNRRVEISFAEGT